MVISLGLTLSRAAKASIKAFKSKESISSMLIVIVMVIVILMLRGGRVGEIVGELGKQSIVIVERFPEDV